MSFNPATGSLIYPSALLSFHKAAQIRYAYQIEDWDKDWQFQRERTLKLGRIPYGKRFLRIKAQAADGQWSKNELKILINVLKPFYLQWWFLFLIAGILLAVILGFYRFNLRRQLEQQEAVRIKELDVLKTNFYTNITHEFRTPLSIIMGMTEKHPGPYR